MFCFRGYEYVNRRYKMNEIVNMFLLAGGKFISEMNLGNPGFTYSACAQFTKIKNRTTKI